MNFVKDFIFANKLDEIVANKSYLDTFDSLWLVLKPVSPNVWLKNYTLNIFVHHEGGTHAKFLQVISWFWAKADIDQRSCKLVDWYDTVAQRVHIHNYTCMKNRYTRCGNNGAWEGQSKNLFNDYNTEAEGCTYIPQFVLRYYALKPRGGTVFPPNMAPSNYSTPSFCTEKYIGIHTNFMLFSLKQHIWSTRHSTWV